MSPRIYSQNMSLSISRGFVSSSEHPFLVEVLSPFSGHVILSLDYTSGLVLWHINYCRLFNAISIFIHINSSISNNSV